MIDSTPPEDLPKTRKKGRSRGLTKAATFAEMIRSIGEETGDYHGLEIPQRQIVIRLIYEALVTGRMRFPDDREIVLDFESWQKLAWDMIKHLDIVTMNALVRESGALVGSSLLTQVVLYMPDNARNQPPSTAFVDPAAQEILGQFPQVLEGGQNGRHTK